MKTERLPLNRTATPPMLFKLVSSLFEEAAILDSPHTKYLDDSSEALLAKLRQPGPDCLYTVVQRNLHWGGLSIFKEEMRFSGGRREPVVAEYTFSNGHRGSELQVVCSDPRYPLPARPALGNSGATVRPNDWQPLAVRPVNNLYCNLAESRLVPFAETVYTEKA